LWSKPKTTTETDTDNHELKVGKVSGKELTISIFVIIFLSYLLGLLMSRIHLIFPVYFPDVASYPYLDSFTTILSFVATLYLARRKIENWHLWIIVDIIGIWLYYQKGVVFLSLLYLAFLINAFFGLAKWNKILNKYDKVI
jgi:nicotinamide mononucleotide transporter